MEKILEMREFDVVVEFFFDSEVMECLIICLDMFVGNV